MIMMWVLIKERETERRCERRDVAQQAEKQQPDFLYSFLAIYEVRAVSITWPLYRKRVSKDIPPTHSYTKIATHIATDT
jgi:hypothetical protein